MSIIFTSATKAEVLASLERFCELAVFPRIERPQAEMIRDHMRFIRTDPRDITAAVEIGTNPTTEQTVFNIKLDFINRVPT